MPRHALILLLAVSCGPLGADEWGAIHGQIVVEGAIPPREFLFAKDTGVKDKEFCAAENLLAEDLMIETDSGGLGNVFVYLSKTPKQIHPDLKATPKESVQVTTEKCQFVPHCLICRTEQVIEMRSDGSVGHYPNSYPQANPLKARLVSPPLQAPEVFRFKYHNAESIPMKVTCDFHSWMKGYWLLLDHPYAALTDKDGKFQIENLPIGNHEFRVWHERVGYIERKYKVAVTAGDPVLLPSMIVHVDKLKKAISLPADNRQR